MNRILIFNHNPDQSEVHITDSTVLHHAHQVLKLQIQDKINLCLVGQSLATAKVTAVQQDKITARILNKEEGLALPFYLQVAASRPPTMKKIIEHGTSLGVTHFDFFTADLSDPNYLQSRIYDEDNINELFALGLAQAKTLTHLPTFNRHQKHKTSEVEQKYFLSIGDHPTIQDLAPDLAQPLCLCVGPERGWTKNEEKDLLYKGYRPVKIGHTVMRTEIATFVALGQLHALSCDHLRTKL